MPILSEKLKEAATAAFCSDARLTETSLDEREQAALWYERLAGEAVGLRAELARLYNLERAKFLRGEVERIAGSAPKFGEEIGYPL